MTNEDAKYWIEICVQDYIRYYDDYPEEILEARDMMFKALEAQTCIEDYPTCTECEHYDSEKHYCPRFCQVIRDTLAEAQPCEDAVSRAEVYDIITRMFTSIEMTNEQWAGVMQLVKDLPSVTPQRPKGKWIKIQSGDKDFPESIVCSRCKNENSHLDFDEHSVPIGKVFVTSKYCPNCGAEMNGGDEDEDGKSL